MGKPTEKDKESLTRFVVGVVVVIAIAVVAGYLMFLASPISSH